MLFREFVRLGQVRSQRLGLLLVDTPHERPAGKPNGRTHRVFNHVHPESPALEGIRGRTDKAADG